MTQAAIVAGVDGSAGSERAVRWAAHEAVLRRAPLQLVTAMVTSRAAWMPPAFFTLVEAEAAKKVDAARLIAEDECGAGSGVQITTSVMHESARPGLIKASKHAAVLVLGSSGEGESGVAQLLGSTAIALAAHAHCPVAVIRKHSRSVQSRARVVVGVDGTKNSEAAIAEAFRAAALRGAELVALHAWSDFRMSTAFTDVDLSWETVSAAEEAVLAERLAGYAADYPDVPVSRAVVRDSPLPHLIAHSRQADLIVAGSHGRGGFTGMLLGSTSAALIEHAHCPVLIVRSRK
ncbi:universal stress protein [Hoyosella altamirensis]|uniref:Nucleotide-binding universal stress UspA family protein n=1 Tax=Hoyosella altamirensis TaxID=616997 RepID=A0A839RKL6_9ACTN|nr:universal stress protein [Hoyosella altamirensis]MBB3036768.1 nucleotide-binding universal stress UspA family protein [Hoyosella altamirensis]